MQEMLDLSHHQRIPLLVIPSLRAGCCLTANLGVLDSPASAKEKRCRRSADFTEL